MKYVCLGYLDETAWDAMPEPDQAALIKECFAYDDVLKKNGHFVRGEALQPARNATTLRFRNGKVMITGGPFSPGSRAFLIAGSLEIREECIYLSLLFSANRQTGPPELNGR